MELKVVKKLVMLARHDGVDQEKMAGFLSDKCADALVLTQAIDEVFSMSKEDWEETSKTFVSALGVNV